MREAETFYTNILRYLRAEQEAIQKRLLSGGFANYEGYAAAVKLISALASVEAQTKILYKKAYHGDDELG